MKKVFMPSMNGLQEMQSLNADVYSYVLIKAVEKFIIEGINYSAKGILNPNCTMKCILNDPEVVIPICRMYPELISRFDFANNDTALCMELLNSSHQEKYASSLDNLAYFDSSAICSNQIIVKDVIGKLKDELIANPKYRFTYKNNALLNQIFATTILSSNNGLYIRPEEKETLLTKLATIEPYYAMQIGKELSLEGYSTQELAELKRELLITSINSYKRRYGITEDNSHKGEDIFTKDNIKVKRLIRKITNDPMLLYKNNN